MIAAFKENGRCYLLTVPYFTRFSDTKDDEILHEDNVNIFKIKDTNICLGSADIGLEADLLKLNSYLFKDGLSLYDVRSGADALKQIYDDYDLLDSNNEIAREIIICDNDNIYKLGCNLEVIKFNEICFADENPADFNYLRTLMDTFTGSIKDRAIGAIKLMLKEFKTKNSKIYIINTMDDDVEIIDAN